MYYWDGNYESYEYTIKDVDVYNNEDGEEITKCIASNYMDYINDKEDEVDEREVDEREVDESNEREVDEREVDEREVDESNEDESSEDESSEDESNEDESIEDESSENLESDNDYEENNNEICKKNSKKILYACCSLYVFMLSIYINTILCTYIVLRC